MKKVLFATASVAGLAGLAVATLSLYGKPPMAAAIGMVFVAAFAMENFVLAVITANKE